MTALNALSPRCHAFPDSICVSLHSLVPLQKPRQRRRCILLNRASSSDATPPEEEPLPQNSSQQSSVDSITPSSDVCLIESRHSMHDFANLQKEELKAQVESRRNKVFLLLEEIRRLRIQLQLKSRGNGSSEEDMGYESVVPIINQSSLLQEKNMKKYIGIYMWVVAGVILFGGLVAPSLEVRMGLGGTSYLEFIQSMHLPEQLAEVDPIVASFCGGAVGALSTLLVVDLNNVRSQQRNRSANSPGLHKGLLAGATIARVLGICRVGHAWEPAWMPG